MNVKQYPEIPIHSFPPPTSLISSHLLPHSRGARCLLRSEDIEDMVSRLNQVSGSILLQIKEKSVHNHKLSKINALEMHLAVDEESMDRKWEGQPKTFTHSGDKVCTHLLAGSHTSPLPDTPSLSEHTQILTQPPAKDLLKRWHLRPFIHSPSKYFVPLSCPQAHDRCQEQDVNKTEKCLPLGSLNSGRRVI